MIVNSNFLFEIIDSLTRNSWFFCYENDKDDVINEVKEAYEMDIYNNYDLHDIADHTTRKKLTTTFMTKNMKKILIWTVKKRKK